MTVRPDGMRFDSVRTLDDAIRTVRALAKEEGISTNRDFAVSSFFVAAATAPMSSTIPQTAAIESRGSLPSNAQLDALLIDFVIDQTGYTPDIVDLDADLEADLRPGQHQTGSADRTDARAVQSSIADSGIHWAKPFPNVARNSRVSGETCRNRNRC